jgi:hypothetical protein
MQARLCKPATVAKGRKPFHRLRERGARDKFNGKRGELARDDRFQRGGLVEWLGGLSLEFVPVSKSVRTIPNLSLVTGFNPCQGVYYGFPLSDSPTVSEPVQPSSDNPPHRNQ